MQLLNWLNDEGYVIERLEPFAWYEQLKKLCYQKPLFLPILCLLSMDEKRNFWSDSNIFHLQFDATHVKQFLDSDYHCPTLTNHLLQTYVNYLSSDKAKQHITA